MCVCVSVGQEDPDEGLCVTPKGHSVWPSQVRGERKHHPGCGCGLRAQRFSIPRPQGGPLTSVPSSGAAVCSIYRRPISFYFSL